MHHAGMSISKSIGAGIGMLWLAQKYGDQVFDLRIADYLEVTADHDGWEEVTFGDVLNMATGVGDFSPTERPFAPTANETGDNYVQFYMAETTAEKLRFAFALDNYPWGPGEIFRYTSSQTFILSAAMDAYLKSQEGPNAHLWERLRKEVFEPIGVYHLTMIHVPDGTDGPGIPLMASGLRYTVDDVGKIVTLLQNGGQHNGEQLLSPTKLAEALYRTGEVIGLPSGKTFAYGDQGYHYSFWSIAYQTQNGRYFQIPFMSGAGGNTIFLAPNGISTFVFTDFNQDGYSLNCPLVAESLRAYPTAGENSGFSQSIILIPERARIRYIILIWLILTMISMVIFIVKIRRRSSESSKSWWVWLLPIILFGPLALVVFLVLDHRKKLQK
jgi:CubicO group peptidase (beta-lactamase class C family)